MSDDETVPVDRDALAEFVLFEALEADAIDVYVPEGVERAQVYEGVSAENVDDVTASGTHIEVEGSFTVRRHVRTIPASGGSSTEPPTNPPEVVFEDQEMFFVIHYYLEDHGHAEGVVDVA